MGSGFRIQDLGFVLRGIWLSVCILVVRVCGSGTRAYEPPQKRTFRVQDFFWVALFLIYRSGGGRYGVG